MRTKFSVKNPKGYIPWAEAYHGVEGCSLTHNVNRLNKVLDLLIVDVFIRSGSPLFLVNIDNSLNNSEAIHLEEYGGEHIDFHDELTTCGTVFFQDNAIDGVPMFCIYKVVEQHQLHYASFYRDCTMEARSGLTDDIDFNSHAGTQHVFRILKTLTSNPAFEDVDPPTLRAQGFGKQKQKSSLLDCERAKILKPRILPMNPVKVDHGGTHASPRPHDRRGHWRRKPKGDTSDLIWVKSSKVGVQR